jgi:hypothetical protein
MLEVLSNAGCLPLLLVRSCKQRNGKVEDGSRHADLQLNRLLSTKMNFAETPFDLSGFHEQAF